MKLLGESWPFLYHYISKICILCLVFISLHLLFITWSINLFLPTACLFGFVCFPVSYNLRTVMLGGKWHSWESLTVVCNWNNLRRLPILPLKFVRSAARVLDTNLLKASRASCLPGARFLSVRLISRNLKNVCLVSFGKTWIVKYVATGPVF